MRWNDVARVYMKACEEENYTEEYRMRCRMGLIEAEKVSLKI